MAARRRIIQNLGLLAAVALTAAPFEAASAQNFFQQLFGVFRHREPVSERVFTDPFNAFARAVSPPPVREERTMGSAFCVRTCDGYHFVVHGNANTSAADMCHAFCPGSETRLFSGSNIDYATAGDGSRYADLDTADVYRRQLVAGCTCNGHDAFGLAHIDPAKDPTLKPGDVVATKDGLVAFTGARDKVTNFTPVRDYGGFSRSYRDQLSQLRIAPADLQAPYSITSSVRPSDDSRSAQK
jgi:Protein of unknown function (DUF2865)